MDIRLGLCSAYSLLYGVRMPEDLLDRAASNGVKVLSICDLNNLYGLHTFLEVAKERNIRPIIGTALMVNNNVTHNFSLLTSNPLYCFAENRTGFARLCEILTIRNRDSKGFNPLPLLREQSGGLVLASADEAVLQNLAGRVKRLYAAVYPSSLGAVSLGRRLHLPLAFLDNSIFLKADDYEVHRVLRAIGLLKTVGNLGDGDTAQKERLFSSAEALDRYLASWPEAVRGTKEIADLCTFDTVFDGWVFPGYGSGLPSADFSAATELRNRVYRGNAKRYGELGDYELERIDYELRIIEEKGFSSYFLTIDDIVQMSKGKSGDNRTCGRGSGAASIVSYGLGITNVDPLRHNLYFERFLNPVRSDPPDLDIDFAWDERDDLIKAVIERFGPDRCARVANHNMFRSRSALRETAKAYGFGDSAITLMERKMQMNDGKGTENEELGMKEDPLWQEIFSLAARIKGLPRGLSMHCGGLVISPGPIYNYAPIEKSAEGFPLLAWEKEGTEAAGFVKIDLLGNRSLAVIRDSIENIEEQENNKPGNIREHLSRAIDDSKTIEALARGDSIGVFYIESPAMRQLQKKTNAGDFPHIVIHSSIIRPAANKFISEYVRRLKGGKWEALHPRLEKILEETYGILCYQEDVSKTAVALAGFNEADADKLRKVIAKKAGRSKLPLYEKQFFEGCCNNGVGEETAKKIWEMMLSFDGYSFCKPHSASYAMVSFQSAYLRVHHPAEFMAAVLSNQGGYYRPHAYIAEARRMQLSTAGPDINISRWKYYGEKNGTVVIGLMAIKGLSMSGAKMILEERERGGRFLTLEEFARRVKPNRDDITALCPAGVFDSIAGGLSRPLQARRLLGANLPSRNLSSGYRNYGLFDTGLDSQKNQHYPLHTSNSLWDEYRALGFLREHHPLTLWKDSLSLIKNKIKEG